MRAKITEVCGEIFMNDELFHTCTTTLSELKELLEDEKIIKESKEEYPENFKLQLAAMNAIKNSPRKFTIEQVIDVCGEVYYNNLSEDKILEFLTKLPPNGIEVEIEGSEIVKVYV